MEVLKLSKLRNFRDLGGIQTLDGRVIKKNLLIRGTTLTKLNKLDIEILKKKYNLSTIIDLRTLREVEEAPDNVLEGVSYNHMPIFNDAIAGLSHEKKVRSIKSLQMMPSMEEMYIHMVTDDCLDNVVAVLKKILYSTEKDFTLLYHCTAGKDRTGIITSLILAFLGVDRKTIIQEYLFTNQFTKRKAKFIYFGLLLIKFRHSFAKKIKQYYIAEEDYIQSSLESIENSFGTLDNFFKDKLGFSDEEIVLIRNKFLE